MAGAALPSMLRTLRRRTTALAALCVLAAAGGLDATTLGELTAEQEARLDGLVSSAVELRGLEAPATIRAGRVDRRGLTAWLDELAAEELPAAEVEPLERALALFGLLPHGVDLRRTYLALLSDQVAAYFDPEEETLVLVDGAAEMLAEGDPELGELLASAIMIHEIGHLLQHEHFDLRRFLDSDLASDEGMAKASLVEGDATLVMLSYLLGFELERFPLADGMLRKLLDDPEAARSMMAGLAGADGAAAPRFLQEGLMFPYLRGLLFCAEVRRAGGQKLLDHAFRVDPPLSSEQVLHPEKWLGERDPPVELELPPTSGIPGVGELRSSGQLGEAQIGVLLAERLGAGGGHDLRAVAAGWGGDRFGLYGEGDSEALAWVTEWDTERDAEEFLAVAGRAFDDSVVVGEGRRVGIVVTAPDGAGESLAWKLLAVPGRRAESAPLDLEALGIGPGDVPTPLTVAEVGRLVERADRVAWLAGLENETAAFSVPELRGSGAAVMEDGVVRLARPALEIALPEAERWERLQADGLEMPVAPSLLARDPGSGATLAVLALESPVPTWLEAVAAGVEASLEGTGVGILERSYGEVGGRRYLALETRFVSEASGVRMLQRIFVFGPWVVTIQASAPEEAWPALESSLRSFVEGVVFAD